MGGKSESELGRPCYESAVESVSWPDSHPTVALGRGMLRMASRGGSLAKRSIRSLFIAAAFISVKPGFCVPTTFEEKDDSSLVACLAWQEGHSVSSTRS